MEQISLALITRHWLALYSRSHFYKSNLVVDGIDFSSPTWAQLNWLNNLSVLSHDVFWQTWRNRQQLNRFGKMLILFYYVCLCISVKQIKNYTNYTSFKRVDKDKHNSSVQHLQLKLKTAYKYYCIIL